MELLTFDLCQFVSVDPFFLVRLSIRVQFKAVIVLLGLFTTGCLVTKSISRTAYFTPMSVETVLPPSSV